MELHLIKGPDGAFRAASIEDAEAIGTMKQGVEYRFTVVKPRNQAFFRKWWALAKFAFEIWEPTGQPNRWGIRATKNFDRFRKDLIILTGRYEAFYRMNGETRIEAKSIAWGSMTELEFAALYSETIDVILSRICSQYTGEELERLSMEALNYA